jgi:hypothetical protein
LKTDICNLFKLEFEQGENLNGETSKNSIYTGRKKIDIQGLFSQVIFIALKGAKRNLQSAMPPSKECFSLKYLEKALFKHDFNKKNY